MSTRTPLLMVVIVAVMFAVACGGGSIGKTTSNQYTVSVTVSGLTGTGLVLQDNGRSNLSVGQSGTFAFSTQIASGGSYAVTVMTQPSGQSCTLGSNASGTATANVTVTVTCTTTAVTYTIGGTLSGLTSGTVVLQDNGGDNLSLTANGTFTFKTALAAGTQYTVTVLTQPAGQTCNVTNGTGTANANVTNVTVACAPVVTTYTIGGTLSGLASGASVVLQDNGGDNLTLSTNGSFTFATAIAAGSNYNVTVLTQPNQQTCTVTNGSGVANANVTTVAVTCASQFTIGGTLSGLAPGTSVVLADNGSFDSLTLNTNGPFAFSRTLAAGTAYSVTVTTQPTGQTCTITNGSGTANSNVTNVGVSCATTQYTLSAAVTGLGSGSLVLQDNAGKQLTFTTNTTETFSNTYGSGATYSVSIVTQPAGQTCTLGSNASGTMTQNTTVNVTCGTVQTFTLSVSVSGLSTGTLTVKDDQNVQLQFTSNITQTFSNTYVSGATYSVSIVTQPTGETCTLGSNAIGTITANTTVTATCSASGNTFTIGGTLYDLSANPSSTGIVLENNGSDNLTLTTNGSFTFSTAVASGAPYDVTVSTQPTSPGQNCTVLNATGTATANVTNVEVVCISEWTWQFGANVVAQTGVYGTKGVASPNNVPGARNGANTWIDHSGNFWLFGGYGYDTEDSESVLNDLWEFSGGEWTWVAGANANGQGGTYNGIGSAGIPGARGYATSWIDTSGNLWLFGGYGVDVNDLSANPLNDLWEFTGGQWIWEGGSDTANAQGTYGTKGTGSTSNIPGARYDGTAAADASGNLWLFGGYGVDSANNTGLLNDLWEFTPSTLSWTWVSGSNVQGQQGSYGTLGQPGANNVPGARQGMVSWFDLTGNFWLFSGNATDSTGNVGEINDLWEFSAGEWTWVGGSNTIDAAANYGTQGIPNASNVPGARFYSTGWRTPSGDVWIFGGGDLQGNYLTDLWKYSGGQWTWMDGSQSPDVVGVYGTLGQPSPTNAPGSRQLAGSWVDANGNLWMFGGYGLASVPAKFDSINDLWEFQP